MPIEPTVFFVGLITPWAFWLRVAIKVKLVPEADGSLTAVCVFFFPDNAFSTLVALFNAVFAVPFAVLAVLCAATALPSAVLAAVAALISKLSNAQSPSSAPTISAPSTPPQKSCRHTTLAPCAIFRSSAARQRSVTSMRCAVHMPPVSASHATTQSSKA